MAAQVEGGVVMTEHQAAAYAAHIHIGQQRQRLVAFHRRCGVGQLGIELAVVLGIGDHRFKLQAAAALAIHDVVRVLLDCHVGQACFLAALHHGILPVRILAIERIPVRQQRGNRHTCACAVVTDALECAAADVDSPASIVE